MIIQELLDLDEHKEIVGEDEEIVSVVYVAGFIVFATRRTLYAMIDSEESLEKLKRIWPVTFDWVEVPDPPDPPFQLITEE